MRAERANIKASLVAKGFTKETSHRDHDYFFLRHRNLTQAVYAKLSRGRRYKTYSDELLGRMSRRLRLTHSQLTRLIDCSMDGAEYIDVLRSQGVIRD